MNVQTMHALQKKKMELRNLSNVYYEYNGTNSIIDVAKENEFNMYTKIRCSRKRSTTC